MKNSNTLFLSLFAFLLTTIFLACSPNQGDDFNDITIEKTENSALLKFTVGETIGSVKGSELIISANQDQIKEVMESNYRDGTQMDQVYISKEEGNYYLYGKGYNGKDEVRILRYDLEEDGNGNLRAANSETNSCSGVNCSYCVFAAGSGCSCKQRGDLTYDGFDKASYCNHSTSSSSGIASLQLLDAVVEAAEVTGDAEITGSISRDIINPELYDQLSQGMPLVTDTDFLISEETMNTIYDNSGVPPASNGPVLIEAGAYDVTVDAQGIIVIVIVTEDVVIIVVIY